jgi:C-terminal processing protease CtpA/Prc
VLRRLIAALDDGHGHVEMFESHVLLPLRLALVEDRIVVLASGAAGIERGDTVLAIDGVAAGTALAEGRAQTSGSPQWRTWRALAELGAGPPGTAAQLIVERAGQRRAALVTRDGAVPDLATYPAVGEVRPGVWLIDLARAEMKDLDARMATLAAARGVIFDVRDYPKGTDGVLAHLLAAPEAARWMHVAHVIRPTAPGSAPPRWSSSGWDLMPAEPRIAGKVVFLTGPGAISYAESVMGYIEALHLPIVGAATAGTNGNVRTVVLPSGAEISFTGMKVTRHDGSRSHVQGIRPTVPVEPTLAGIRAGRDEVLERALALIEGP